MINLLAAADSGNFADDTQLYDRSVGTTNTILDYWWVGGLAILAIVAVKVLNGAKRKLALLNARCKTAFGDVDAILSERHALIPNLVEVTKAHSDQDLAVLDRLLDAHQLALETMGDNRLNAETEVGNALNQLVNVASSMPKLSSSSQFVTMKQDLIRIEEKITAARRYYNMTIEEYEAERGGWLTGIIAAIFRMPQHPRFDLGSQRAEIEAPQRVSFS